jgi:hypothetical protein
MLKESYLGSFAICYAVSHRSLTMEVCVSFQCSPCGICGIQNVLEKIFVGVLWFFFVIIIPSMLHMYSFVCH